MLLGRFSDVAVGIEGGQLLLHSVQGVGKLAVVEFLDGELDPVE